MFYINRIPRFLRAFLPGHIWEMPSDESALYLSFDDGPHPVITPFVLDALKKYNAKATFFCIGNNVALYPDIYQRIQNEGHAIGNHTMNHLNGWKVKDEDYLKDIEEAAIYIDTNLFRPPYGKITRFQQKQLEAPRFGYTTVMWSILSADFDQRISKERCLQNVVLYAKAGSIIVFHDSKKAFKNLEYTLPKTLEYFTNKGFSFKKIERSTVEIP